MQLITQTIRYSACRLARYIHINRRPPIDVTHCKQANLFNQQYLVFPKIKVSTTRSMSSSTIYTVDYLSEKIQKELQAEHVDIEDLSNCGCGMKFDAVIVSPQFEGKPILQRQRLVNQTLAEEMKHIHAFTMRTLTPSQWKDSQSKKGKESA